MMTPELYFSSEFDGRLGTTTRCPVPGERNIPMTWFTACLCRGIRRRGHSPRMSLPCCVRTCLHVAQVWSVPQREFERRRAAPAPDGVCGGHAPVVAYWYVVCARGGCFAGCCRPPVLVDAVFPPFHSFSPPSVLIILRGKRGGRREGRWGRCSVSDSYLNASPTF